MKKSELAMSAALILATLFGIAVSPSTSDARPYRPTNIPWQTGNEN